MILQEALILPSERDSLWQMMHQMAMAKSEEESGMKQLERTGMTPFSNLKDLTNPSQVAEYLKMIENVNKSNIYKSISIFIFFNQRYANEIKFMVILFL